MKKLYQNILLIAGTGQNVGKTLFASQVIAQHANTFTVISVKIAPHFHTLNSDLKIIDTNNDYLIAQELNPKGNKDTQRFLKAGSKQVYYIQCKDEQLLFAFEKLIKLLPQNAPIICESGGLIEFIKPGLFIIINKKNNNIIKPQTIKNREIANKWIEFDGSKFDFNPHNFQFSEHGWIIQN